jgi:hypothetical protein
VHVHVLHIGGGMAGHHAMYVLSYAGIGNSSNLGTSGNKGVMLIEKDNANCGIIHDITYPIRGPVSGPLLIAGWHVWQDKPQLQALLHGHACIVCQHCKHAHSMLLGVRAWH